LEVSQDRNIPDHQKLIGVADTFQSKFNTKVQLPKNRLKTSREWRTNVSRYEGPQSGRCAVIVESIPVTFAKFGMEF
jgi:hypothetical protein